MEVLKKLQKARQMIKDEPMKKKGLNTFSKYEYFTPEQISGMVSKVNSKLNLFHKFSLIREQYGLVAYLTIYDLDSDKSIEFQIATEIPEIKATNVAQQLGGCVTYSERYLLQIAYDIKDNNLDFDTDKPKEKVAVKHNLTPDDTDIWDKAVTYLKGEGNTISNILKRYDMTPENIDNLQREAI